MATKTSATPFAHDFYAIVGNIPPNYHSADLRRFFSRFIENDGFICFHFRHRPEGKNPVENANKPENEPTSSMGISTNDGFDVNKYSKKPKRSKIDKTLKTCCIIKLTESKYQELVQLYHKKHWLNSNGDGMGSLCFISKLKLNVNPSSDGTDLVSGSDTVTTVSNDSQSLTESDLGNIPELNPPSMMPNGNVGTPSKVFLDLIKQCMLPPKIIKNLGLTFPKSSCKGIYSNMTFDYGETQSNHKHAGKSKLSRHRNVLLSQSTVTSGSDSGSVNGVKDQGKINQKASENRGKHEPVKDDDSGEKKESESEEDVDDCEEWERHEALWDDPANIERNKERKYEEEMEVVWEKGGPGLVWYTDDLFWRQKDGDFDEQTADDWDVDMSVYYDSNGGDMDARDMVSMRRSDMRKKGYIEHDDPCRSTSSGNDIGKFEKYTRGIGRHVLEKQGWTEGAGLGSTSQGMAQALDNDGQKPMDKTGFGYRGEKVPRFGWTSQRKRIRRDAEDVIISTVYDNPKDMELPEEVLRRREHKTMTYRDKVRKYTPDLDKR